MKGILILVALSLFLCSTASAFQDGGGKATKQKADTKKNSGTTSEGQSQRSRPTANYRATVNTDEAVFMFPLTPKKVYQWSGGGLQYSWVVRIRSQNRNYKVGFTLFTPMGATPPEKGSFQKLLNSGQLNIWREDAQPGNSSVVVGVTNNNELATWEDKEAGKVVVEEARVTGFLNKSGDGLIIKVSGRKAVQSLFSNRPENIFFESHQRGVEQTARCTVEYVGN